MRIAACRAGAVLAAALLAGPARADTAPPPAAPPAGAPVAVVQGFRDAHFGMTESAVKQAIETDFHVPPAAIKSATDPVLQTLDLSVSVPGLLAGMGKGQIDYVFGYKSHALVEVNIAWSTAADPVNSAANLARAAADLQSYFHAEAFPPGNTAVNVSLPNGTLLVFRGVDGGGHAVLLTLAGPLSKPDKNKHVGLTPALLTLVYAADPAHPDVYTVPSGSF